MRARKACSSAVKHGQLDCTFSFAFSFSALVLLLLLLLLLPGDQPAIYFVTIP
jgi:hypothetical protein